MPSICWVELCSNGQAAVRREGRRDKEKQETEVPCSNNESAASQRQREPGTEHLSPDCHAMQEVTSEGASDQAQREETVTQEKRIGFYNLSVKKKRQHGGKVPGTRVIDHHLQRSKPVLTAGRERHVEEPLGPGPFYYFGGENGKEIVSNYCKCKGWKRIYDSQREDFKLKWCESNSAAAYKNLREGQQLMFQIPNNKVLTSKSGLISSLQEYERVCSKVKYSNGNKRLKLEDFIPTTFRTDVRKERELFFSHFAQQEGEKEDRMWICKPTDKNRGRGITLLRGQEDVDALRLKIQELEEKPTKRVIPHQEQAYVVQHYILNPLLLNGRKFDVRSYLLIACTAPFMVFFHHGYVRLTCDVYDPKSKDLSTHLTNQYIQKKHPLYSVQKEDTVWSMEKFNAYVNYKFQVAKSLPRDWVLGAFAKRMQQIMIQCFQAAKSKLSNRLGFFDLFGCDFIIDEDFKVWLLEVNCNPALHTDCKVLQEVIPSTVQETLDLSLEIFDKCCRGEKILPLTSQKDFVLLYNGPLAPGSAQIVSKRDQVTKKTHKTEPQRFKPNTKAVGINDNSVNEKCNNSTSASLRPNPVSVGTCFHDSKAIKHGKNIHVKLDHSKAVNDVRHPKTPEKTRTTGKQQAPNDRSSNFSAPYSPSKRAPLKRN
nr:protein polyglycylase TTLL10 isoform X1 [Nothobranchius furzeri]